MIALRFATPPLRPASSSWPSVPLLLRTVQKEATLRGCQRRPIQPIAAGGIISQRWASFARIAQLERSLDRLAELERGV
jgi:hypothetical protein